MSGSVLSQSCLLPSLNLWVCPRASCSSPRLRISTMMRSQTTPLHQSWSLRGHNTAACRHNPLHSRVPDWAQPVVSLSGLSWLWALWGVTYDMVSTLANSWTLCHPAFTSLLPKITCQELAVFGEWDVVVKGLWKLVRAKHLHVHKVMRVIYKIISKESCKDNSEVLPYSLTCEQPVLSYLIFVTECGTDMTLLSCPLIYIPCHVWFLFIRYRSSSAFGLSKSWLTKGTWWECTSLFLPFLCSCMWNCHILFPAP